MMSASRLAMVAAGFLVLGRSGPVWAQACFESVDGTCLSPGANCSPPQNGHCMTLGTPGNFHCECKTVVPGVHPVGVSLLVGALVLAGSWMIRRRHAGSSRKTAV
jgi:MYXO-CTERM domain-containing protein